MQPTSRLYFCLLCYQKVVICSHCDRGHEYCSKACSTQARKINMKASSRRYQDTFIGKLAHALRQSDYRARLKKVTHQGFYKSPLNDSLASSSEAPVSPAVIEDEGIICHFCTRMCSAFLRLDYLHRTLPFLVSDRTVTHSPPPLWAQAP